MKNIPNILSVFRLILVPVFVVVFWNNYPENVMTAMFVFLLAGATDVVDGYIARRYNCISKAGKVLDPLADKLMQMAVLVCLFLKDFVPLWLLILLVSKEIFILVCGGLIIRLKKTYVVSSWFGKAAVCMFYLGVCYFMLRPQFNIVAKGDILIVSLLMGGCALGALVMYVYQYYRKLEMGKYKKLNETEESEKSL